MKDKIRNVSLDCPIWKAYNLPRNSVASLSCLSISCYLVLQHLKIVSLASGILLKLRQLTSQLESMYLKPSYLHSSNYQWLEKGGHVGEASLITLYSIRKNALSYNSVDYKHILHFEYQLKVFIFLYFKKIKLVWKPKVCKKFRVTEDKRF